MTKSTIRASFTTFFWRILLLLVSSGAKAESLKVWAEVPLARAPVGLVDDKVLAYRVVTLGVALPQSSDVNRNWMERCSIGALGTVAQLIRNRLGLDRDWGDPGKSSPPLSLGTVAEDLAQGVAPVTADSFNQTLNARASAIGNIVASHKEELVRNLVTCGGSQFDAFKNSLTLLVNVRACPARTSVCAKIDEPTIRGYTTLQFEKIYGWLTVAQPRNLNGWLEAAGTEQIRSVAVGIEPLTWPVPPAPEEVQKQLQRYINAAHTGSSRLPDLSYVVPSLLGVSKESLVHMLDLVNHPFAASLLMPQSGGLVLSEISDEVARSRLMECAQLRGNLDFDGIQKCAGITLDESALLRCLNNADCLPAYDRDALAAILAIKDPGDLAKIAEQTVFPRVASAVKDLKDWESKAETCGVANKGDQVASAKCLLQKTLTPSDYAAVECVQATRSPSVHQKQLLECVSKLVKDGPEKQALDCWSDGKRSPSDAARCAALASAPVEVQKAIACAENLRNRPSAAVLISCAGSISAEDQKLLTCIADANTSTAKSLCVGGRYLPTESKPLIACAQSSNGDWKDMALCVAAEKIPLKGDAGKAIACGLKNGGNYAGTALCLAGGTTGLTAEQQIVLQCAVTSAAPPAFAICVSGQLAFKEFLQCKDVRVGEGACFGKNNEIRRFVRNLGLGDIGPNSEVAKVMDLHVDVLRFQYALAEKGVVEISSGISDIAKVIADVGGEVQKRADDALNRLKNPGKNPGKTIVCVASFGLSC